VQHCLVGSEMCIRDSKYPPLATEYDSSFR
jgi:hypothetical protein